MCTDVDRNDKSRICVPGSVRVIGRRQIEMYSRLIHTVDHVEGRLRPGFDALDAFLTHTWAVTVTGAPKAWAMQFIEDHERSPRAWYGGAVGLARLRRQPEHRADAAHDPGQGRRGRGARGRHAAVRLRPRRGRGGDAPQGVGVPRRDPAAPRRGRRRARVRGAAHRARARRVLLVDHQDSFVHTLANYFRQTGAEVTTLRAGFPAERARRAAARPGGALARSRHARATSTSRDTLTALLERGIPIFGVCLGLQGIVEHFGGELGVLDYPMHGKASPHPRPWRAALRRAARRVHRGPLPLALRAPREAARRCSR